MAQTPHILVIPSWYPTEEDLIVGNFFNEQTQMVRKTGVQVGVIYPEIRPLKSFSLPLLCKNYFQISYQREAKIPTMRMHGWNIFPGYLKGTMHFWVQSALKLFEYYVRQEGMPDLIHAHSALWAGVAAKAIAEKYKVPYVVTEHRDNFLHDRIFPHLSSDSWVDHHVRETFHQAAQVIAVSRALKKGLTRWCDRDIAVVPNFLDMDDFIPSFVPKPREPFTFLTLAHLVPSKNIALLLQAFQQLIQKDCNVHLNIGGDGPEKNGLVALASRLGIQNRVTFLGRLQRQQVKQAYASSHAFVLPSHYETFGIVFIEALAMGLPVIGTRCGGPEDIIQPEVGCLVDLDRVDELADRMLHIKDHVGDFPALKLREYAYRSFGKKTVVQRLIALYQSQIEKFN